MAGTFELYTDAGDHHRFRLDAANGQAIASSEARTTKVAANRGNDPVRTDAPGADLVDTTA